VLLEIVRFERSDGPVVGDLEAESVADLYSRVLDVLSDELRQLLHIWGDDPDPARAEGVKRVYEGAGRGDRRRRRVLALEDRFDLGLDDAVVLWPLRHDRDQTSGGNDARAHVRELRGSALCLRIHHAQLLGCDIRHPQASTVDAEALFRPLALTLAQKPGNLRLHGRVRARTSSPMRCVALIVEKCRGRDSNPHAPEGDT
jgi:hypothetical protein